MLRGDGEGEDAHCKDEEENTDLADDPYDDRDEMADGSVDPELEQLLRLVETSVYGLICGTKRSFDRELEQTQSTYKLEKDENDSKAENSCIALVCGAPLNPP